MQLLAEAPWLVAQERKIFEYCVQLRVWDILSETIAGTFIIFIISILHLLMIKNLPI